MPSAGDLYPLRTEPFRVSRLAFAYLALFQYVRMYWWFVSIIPIFGIACLFGPGVFKVIGLMAVLWPISLPARAILATSKAGKLMEKGVWASYDEDTLFLHGDDAGLKLNLRSVRKTLHSRGFLVLVLARGAFIALPLASCPPDFVRKVEQDVLEMKNEADIEEVAPSP